MEQWIGPISVVVGGLLGGTFALLGVHLQSQRQRREDTKRFILPKLEELHELVTEYRRCCKQEGVEMVARLNRMKLTEKETAARRPLPTAKLNMLVGFYAPELRESLAHLQSRQEELIEVYLSVMRPGALRSETRAETSRRTESVILALDAACDEVQQQTTDAARQYL